MSRSGWREPVQIADAVTATLRRLGLDGRYREHGIWRVWPQTVGPEIAQHAQPHSLRHGRLVVHVTDSVWLYHLSMMRHRILAALNERLKPTEVREIALRVGEVVPTPTASWPPRSSPAPTCRVDPVRVAEIDRALAPLGDAPFRDVLRTLWLRAAGESAAEAQHQDTRQSR